MPFSFCVLGSGSKGNCTVLSFQDGDEERCVLIDCGLSPLATRKRLAPLGIEIGQVTDILLTHLDWDHFYQSWPKALDKHGIKVHLHERHRSAALRRGAEGRHLEMFRDDFTLFEGCSIEPVMFAHDQLGAVGYVIEYQGRRLGFATDLGRVPEAFRGRFVNLDALAMESNYDPAMQMASPRPAFLKQRIMGGMGHLSNEQSIEAVTCVAEQSDLAHIVTIHLSEQCNDPRIVKSLYSQRAPELLDRLTISSQREPTPLLHVNKNGSSAGEANLRPGQQAAMF